MSSNSLGNDPAGEAPGGGLSGVHRFTSRLGSLAGGLHPQQQQDEYLQQHQQAEEPGRHHEAADEDAYAVLGPLSMGSHAAGEGLTSERHLLQTLPPASPLCSGVKEYLQNEIVPALLPALAALCEERPPAPIEYLAHYLLEKSHQRKT